MEQRIWDIWVDTGGTFTDAVATSPEGQVLRQKVMSTGTLRATVVSVEAAGYLRLKHGWGPWASVNDAAAGWSLRRLGTADQFALKAWQDGCLALAEGSAGFFANGDVVELCTGEEAPIVAARLLTRTPARYALPPIRLRLATTRGTNALLTGAVAPTALVINRGFGDLLQIGTQQRPELFALEIRKPSALHARVIEVEGRLDAHGVELAPLDLDGLAREARSAISAGIQDAAICLMHSDLNPAHEEAAAAVLLDSGFSSVTCSSRAAPFVKLLPRATTALVNACLTPVIDGYLSGARRSLCHPESTVLVMSSAGGLVPAASFMPKDSLLSGPAAGVVGAAQAAAEAGFDKAVSFDMGGTSTDAARWSRAKGIEYVFEHTVGAATLLAPAAAVETVAAGGGSICSFRDGALSVGPESAGASPGPACYGAGGPLTLTDVNLLLGRLCPDRFVIPVNIGAAERALREVARSVAGATGREWSKERLLEGFLEIAAERMAGAVRRTSTRRGHDLSGAALVAFGGAGGQHACAIARSLGLETILAPADAGLLSARGLGAASIERFASRQILLPLEEAGPSLNEWLEELAAECLASAARGAGVESAEIRRRIAAARFAGQETPIELELPARGRVESETMRELFSARHEEIYGFAPPQRRVELVWLRTIAAATLPAIAARMNGSSAPRAQGQPRTQHACFDGRWLQTPVIERGGMKQDVPIDGPAIIAEDHSTLIIEPGWSARLSGCDAIVMHAAVPADSVQSAATSSDTDDPAAIELFTARLESLAREMGEMLARTSVSVNVKERLDFSCALLDPAGSLIACAPHVPVHLGSLGVCVRAVVRALALGPGDSAITNHPALGGSHLPDITVITPVHDDAGGLLGYVASRAHHAEIGGRTPGSMPPDARSLAEEGVVITPFRIVEAGRLRDDALAAVLSSGPFPSRNIPDNLADVRAALAANARGVQMLRELAAAHGAEAVRAFMEAIQRRSESLLRHKLRSLPSGLQRERDAMDDGSPIQVAIERRGDELTIDFSGSSGVHPGNMNATPAIIASCVVYVMRILLGHPVPLNEGLLRPVRITLPAGMLNPPFDASTDPAEMPAVVGGNVETSQRVVDVLLRALGLCASSQGTMNNFVFGTDGSDAAPSYYETIGGGAGAGPRSGGGCFAGASSVHTHMTNTRITDPEIIERRYPVRLEQFSVRAGSGGGGLCRGGDGIERVIRFLSPLRVSLLTQRRLVGPPGLNGGMSGAPGEQFVARTAGGVQRLASVDGFLAYPGDVLTIRTPGGGGYGPPKG